MSDHPPPSAAAAAIGAGIIAGVAGYYLGQAQSIGVFASKAHTPSRARASAPDDDSDLSDSEVDTIDNQHVETFDDSTEECKLVFVVRTDLGMTKGRSRRGLSCTEIFHDLSITSFFSHSPN